jgi:hypothetical protein
MPAAEIFAKRGRGKAFAAVKAFDHLNSIEYVASRKLKLLHRYKAKAAVLHQAARVHVATLAAKIGGYSRQIDLHMYLQSHSFEFIISHPLKKCNRYHKKQAKKSATY